MSELKAAQNGSAPSDDRSAFAEPSLALLPSGFRDLLPPEAEAERETVDAIGAVFTAHGFERVEPPLLEFADSLLAGAGAAVAEAVFRMVDPVSGRTMGIRPDITPQVARIAATRLARAPRPLRLAYAGHCVTLRAGQLTSDRQLPQTGIELIGPDLPEADAEVVTVGAEALNRLGIARLSFDLTMPLLAPTLLDESAIAATGRELVMRALDRKDVASVRRHAGPLAPVLEELLLSAGPADRALDALDAAPLLPRARALCARLAGTVAAIRAHAPDLRLTIDPLEFRGWRYHTGMHVSIFGGRRSEEFGRGGRQEELGRGGRYGGVLPGEEPACGLTLFPAAILRATEHRARRSRVFVPRGASVSDAAALRAHGHVTVRGLEPVDDPAAEARRLDCDHLLDATGALAPTERP